jgi:putative membrane protein
MPGVAPVTAIGESRPASPARETLRQLGLRDLVLAGLTSNHMASALLLAFVAWQFLDEILPEKTYERLVLWATQSAQRWIEQVGEQSWVVFLIAGAALILMGMIISVVGSVILFYGFVLSRSGEDLHRSYGLLTRRSSSLPRRRIQVLQVEESLLRRLFRLASLRADSAGSRPMPGEQSRGGRDVLLPIVRRTEVDDLLPAFFPDLESDSGEWRRVSRRAVRRGTVKGSIVLVILAAVAFWVQGNWRGLWPLLFLPAVYGLNVMSYRHLGYLLGERYFRTRRGWLTRATHIVPIRKAQAIVLRQTPFDRRHGVATLAVDTAGQTNTGGGPRINNLPWKEAVVLARTLAQRAAATKYRW